MVDRQLERDQDRGSQSGDLTHVPAARDERDQHGKRARRGPDDRLQPVEIGLAPDAEGRIAPGLVGDRAVVRLRRAAVDDERQHRHREHDDQRGRKDHRPAAGEQRREHDRPELGRRGQRDRGAGRERRPARIGEQRPRAEQRHHRVVGVRLERK